MFDTSTLKPGDKIIVTGVNGEIVDLYDAPENTLGYKEVETIFVCDSNWNHTGSYVIVLKPDGWLIRAGEINAPKKFHEERGYRILKTSILRAVNPRPARKPMLIICRGCGSKFSWTVGTSKRAYLCRGCRAI